MKLPLNIFKLFFLFLFIKSVCAQTLFDGNQVAAANNKFAIDLMAKLSEQHGNLIASPFSINTCLLMTYTGARGNTAIQIAKALNLSDFGTNIHKSLLSLVPEDKGTNFYDSQFIMANSVWAQRGYTYLDSFKKVLYEEYHSELHTIDLSGWPNEYNPAVAAVAREQINEWVTNKTKGIINNILPIGLPSLTTKLLLINAVYFKDMWTLRFDKQETKNAMFYLDANDSVMVPMMHQKNWFYYSTNDDFEMLELPYHADKYSMTILLPKQRNDLLGSKQLLTLDTIIKLETKKSLIELNVSVPKFKVSSQFDLATILQSMGIKDAFSEASADFSGITAAKPFFIEATIHKADIHIDENGTEAAAFSFVTITDSIIGPDPVDVTFRADHPFYFFIRDHSTGAILFVGKIVDPSKE